ncbi:MAG: hypothetical protein AABY15_06535 [Nanoarchaeota archaeon]
MTSVFDPILVIFDPILYPAWGINLRFLPRERRGKNELYGREILVFVVGWRLVVKSGEGKKGKSG